MDVSVVVPILNEAANLAPLLARIAAALRGVAYEVIFVDDGSRDGTPDVCRLLKPEHPLMLFVREDPAGGLSGAVLYGLERARGEFLVVMDGDLQHPPEKIPDLLLPLRRNEAEFVLGSRYVPGGSTAGNWGRLRRANSRVATLLARPFAGRTHDPMSGFFALRRQTYVRADRLNPIGYKIALELMCKCRVRRVREVPIDFDRRAAGRSKLNLAQQVRYIDHLSRLYDFCFPRGAPRVKFVLATAAAGVAAFSLYVRLVANDVNPVFAPTLAFVGAAIMMTLFYVRWLRARGHPVQSGRAWRNFALVLLGEWSVCTLTARWVAFHVMHASVLQVFLLTFGAAAVARFALRKQIMRDMLEAGGAERSPQRDAAQFASI